MHESCPTLRQPLTRGPVLALDLDGVCVPDSGDDLERRSRFSRKRPPPGWIGRGQDSCHGKFPAWLDELAEVYAHVCWISTGMANGCYNFAKNIGYKRGCGWYYIGVSHNEEYDHISESKIAGVLDHVAPNVPLAVVDDWMFSFGETSLNALFARPAPTFALATDPTIGFGRTLVDHLIDFARHPDKPMFNHRKPAAIYLDPHLRWESGHDDEPDGMPTERGKLRETLLPDEIDYLRNARYIYNHTLLPKDWTPDAEPIDTAKQ